MAGAESHEAEQFKGLKKYFNSHTDLGRGNSAKAVYALLALTFGYFYLRKKSN